MVLVRRSLDSSGSASFRLRVAVTLQFGGIGDIGLPDNPLGGLTDVFEDVGDALGDMLAVLQLIGSAATTAVSSVQSVWATFVAILEAIFGCR